MTWLEKLDIALEYVREDPELLEPRYERREDRLHKIAAEVTMEVMKWIDASSSES